MQPSGGIKFQKPGNLGQLPAVAGMTPRLFATTAALYACVGEQSESTLNVERSGVVEGAGSCVLYNPTRSLSMTQQRQRLPIFKVSLPSWSMQIDDVFLWPVLHVPITKYKTILKTYNIQWFSLSLK